MFRRIIPVLILVLLLTSCNWLRTPQADPEPDLDFTREEIETLPGDVQDWVEDSRTMHIAQSKVFQGTRYILASLGERATSGYGIHIEDVDIGADKITVTISHTAPGPNQNVTEVVTYPQDIVSIANLDLPIEYVATGDLEYIPTLQGIEELPPIQAQSPGIKVLAPAPNSTVEDTFTVEGVANLFEGAFSYLLRDIDGTATEEQYAIAGMGDWYYYELSVTVPAELSQEFTLELFSYSARDNSVINLVEIPLNKKQAGD